MKLVIVTQSYLDKTEVASYLTHQEIACLSLILPGRQPEWKLGRFALKYAYSDRHINNLPIHYNSLGQPIIKNIKKLGSIAHSQNLALGALSDSIIGADVEKIRSHHKDLLEYISRDEEKLLFSEKDKDRLVTKVWVIKEAVAKAIGIGIDYPFKKIIILEKDRNLFIVKASGYFWQVELFELDEYILGIATLENDIHKGKMELIYLT